MKYALLLLSCLWLGACQPAQAPASATTPPPATLATPDNDDASACAPQVVQALSRVQTVCGATARNQACYGNALIEAELTQNTTPFAQAGDIVPFVNLRSLRLLANAMTGDYGVALLQLQANLPDTLPGQNVTFLLFGNAELRDAGVDGLYFRSGVGDPICAGLPRDGLLVQTPKGIASVNFRLNGVSIGLGSTAYFEYADERRLRVNVVEGNALLEAEGVVQAVPSGTYSEIALDDTGEAVAPPTLAQAYDPAPLQALPMSALGRSVPIAPPLTPREGKGRVQVVDANGRPSSRFVVRASLPDGGAFVDAAVTTGALELDAGAYDIQIDTKPAYRVRVNVVAGQTLELRHPPVGRVQVVDATGAPIDYLVTALLPNSNTYADTSLSGGLTLVEGAYTFEIRTSPFTRVEVRVVADETLNVPLPPIGRVQVVDETGAPVRILISATVAGTNVVADSRLDGTLTLVAGAYDLRYGDSFQYRASVTVQDGETTLVRLPSASTAVPTQNERPTLRPAILPIATAVPTERPSIRPIASTTTPTERPVIRPFVVPTATSTPSRMTIERATATPDDD
jgi:hypothetical protein